VSTSLELGRPRTLGELLDMTFGLQRQWFAVFFWVTAIVNVPVAIAVDGAWVGEFHHGQNASGAPGAVVASFLLTRLVVPALVTALHVRIVQALAAGQEPSVAGAFRLVGSAAWLALAATALYILGTIVGFLLLIVPGVIVAVRWYFAPQVAVVDRRPAGPAVAASSDLVRGRFWPVAGTLLVGALVFGILTAVPEAIIGAAGVANWIYVAAHAILGTIGVSLTALFGTLLFFSLRATVRPEGPAVRQ
jgi:hypothetical protein